MTSTWGGPDIPLPPPTINQDPNSPPQSPATIPPSPVFPGFDTFAITRFSPLSWAIPSTPSFRIADPGSRALVYDIAALQQEILKKTGTMYLEALARELSAMGVGEADVGTYLEKVRGSAKGFKDFLVTFLGRA
jgi:exportin-T